MKVLISLIVVLATSSAAFSANIPFGYNCTSDLLSICESDEQSSAPDTSPASDGGVTDGGSNLSEPTDSTDG